jgi:hypothetical protein
MEQWDVTAINNRTTRGTMNNRTSKEQQATEPAGNEHMEQLTTQIDNKNNGNNNRTTRTYERATRATRTDGGSNNRTMEQQQNQNGVMERRTAQQQNWQHNNS